MGFPGGLVGKKNLPAVQEATFNPWFEKTLWRRKWQPIPVSLPWKSYGQRSLADYSPWDRKSWTQLSD